MVDKLIFEWMPTDLKAALSLDYIPITLYNSENEKEIKKNCYKSKQVGLTCVHKKSKFLVCLTTQDNIYVINLDNDHERLLLKKMLLKQQDRRFNFYVYKGQEAARHLWRLYELDLETTVDLSTLDIFLSMRTLVLSGQIYSYTIENLAPQRIRYRDRVSLAAHHLNVVIPYVTDVERESLLDLPSMTASAANCIRKMAATTRAVAVKILDKLDELIFMDSKHMYQFGIKASDEDMEAFNTQDERSYQRMRSRLDGLLDIE